MKFEIGDRKLGKVADISLRADLRLKALGDETSQQEVRDYVNSMVPSNYGNLLLICDLEEICKMDAVTFRETIDLDVYVEETIISASLDPSNPAGSEYAPKKVRLFVWEDFE